MKINPNSSVPVYRQIVREIQSAIAAGIFLEGEAIPSTRELSMRLNVNPNTIQKSFDELSLLGVIETRRGLGKFVCKGAIKDSVKRTRQDVLELFREGVQKAVAAGLDRSELDQLFERAARGLRTTAKTK